MHHLIALRPMIGWIAHFLTHGEWVMAVLTAIYVCLTGWYVRVAHRTLKTIQSQADAAQTQFAQQLEVAREAANAARRNAMALINVERAWILVKLHNRMPPSQNYNVVVSNTGKTMALLEHFSLRWGVTAPDSDKLPELTDAESKDMNIFILADKEDWIIETVELSHYFSERWSSLSAGTQLGIVEVSLRYADVVGGEAKHLTRMVYLLNPKMGALSNLPNYNGLT